MNETTQLIVEIHVPLTPVLNVPAGEDPFPWIDDVMDAILRDEADGELEMYDDGEEWNDSFVFSIAGASESELLAAARKIAELPTVPFGVYAVVTDSDAEEFGVGTRIDIS